MLDTDFTIQPCYFVRRTDVLLTIHRRCELAQLCMKEHFDDIKNETNHLWQITFHSTQSTLSFPV